MTTTAQGGRLRRIGPAVGLFLLAPFVGEYVLGNVSLSGLILFPVLALLYGSGALLIREASRRAGRGWPTIAVLAVAYALLEEGPVDQLLWNDSYAGHDYLHGPSFVPVLGTSVEALQSVIAIHAVWSICVPIAIMETFAVGRRTEPWLGRVGLVVTGVVFVLGAGFIFVSTYAEERFLAPVGLQVGALAVIGGLVVLALRLPRRTAPPAAGRVPAPLWVGVVALVGTSAYWGPSALVGDEWYEWVGVVGWLVVAVAGIGLVARWSGRAGWDQRHRFALAAGALTTYVWAAFPVVPELILDPPAVDLAGNIVFGLVAVLLLVLAGRVAGRGEYSGHAVT